MIKKNDKTEQIINDLFKERRNIKDIAFALFSVAKTQLSSNLSSLERGMTLDFSSPGGEITGSNRAGQFEDRFITTIGNDVQGASFQTTEASMGGSQFVGTYKKLSGTSQATPLVTSALALILQKHPDISAPKAMNLLLNTAQPTDYPWLFGRGLMDLPKAME